MGTLLWMQADRELSHFTGCQGAVGEGPKLQGVGSWSWKVALPQRDAWGQPGEGAQGFPPGRQHKGLGGGEGSLGGGGRDQHTDRERWRGLWQPPEAGAQRSAPGTLQSSKAGAAVPRNEGVPDRAWTWCGRRGFGQWAGLGPGPHLFSCPEWGDSGFEQRMSSVPRLGLGVSTSPSTLSEACPSPLWGPTDNVVSRASPACLYPWRRSLGSSGLRPAGVPRAPGQIPRGFGRSHSRPPGALSTERRPGPTGR